ncbi:MAG: hypothetical protein ACYTGB_20655 [Planctomycetota bacterium]|jgi:hypothetical protein
MGNGSLFLAAASGGYVENPWVRFALVACIAGYGLLRRYLAIRAGEERPSGILRFVRRGGEVES